MSENTNLKIALDNASDLFNNNNLNECIEQLEEILNSQPSNLKAWSLLLDININDKYQFKVVLASMISKKQTSTHMIMVQGYYQLLGVSSSARITEVLYVMLEMF